MQILITTSGRSNNQITWNNLPPSIQANTTLIVQNHERGLYPSYPIRVLPPEIRTLSPTRDWCVENATDRFICLLDDDMRFFRRREDDRSKFLPATRADIIEMFEAIDNMLLVYAHTGIAAREGANRNTQSRMFNTRIMRLLAYDTDIIKKHGFKFGKLPCMSDFHMTLELLKAKYPNAIENNWCNDQQTSDAPGGCSVYRTEEVHTYSAMKLAELHAPFVKTVVKKTKGAWKGRERTDVVIQWKRAYGQ